MRLNADNEEFAAFKNGIPDELHDHVFEIFFDLAEKPANLSEAVLKDRELYYSITLESMKAGFHKVFGTTHDALAEMIFRYMSDLKKESDDVMAARVNYLTFLQKFEVLIPAKPAKFSKYTDPSDKQQALTKMRRDHVKRE